MICSVAPLRCVSSITPARRADLIHRAVRSGQRIIGTVEETAGRIVRQARLHVVEPVPRFHKFSGGRGQRIGDAAVGRVRGRVIDESGLHVLDRREREARAAAVRKREVHARIQHERIVNAFGLQTRRRNARLNIGVDAGQAPTVAHAQESRLPGIERVVIAGQAERRAVELHREVGFAAQVLRGLGCRVGLDDDGRPAHAAADVRRCQAELIDAVFHGRRIELAERARDGARAGSQRRISVRPQPRAVEHPLVEVAARHAAIDVRQGSQFDDAEPLVERDGRCAGIGRVEYLDHGVVLADVPVGVGRRGHDRYLARIPRREGGRAVGTDRYGRPIDRDRQIDDRRHTGGDCLERYLRTGIDRETRREHHEHLGKHGIHSRFHEDRLARRQSAIGHGECDAIFARLRWPRRPTELAGAGVDCRPLRHSRGGVGQNRRLRVRIGRKDRERKRLSQDDRMVRHSKNGRLIDKGNVDLDCRAGGQAGRIGDAAIY